MMPWAACVTVLLLVAALVALQRGWTAENTADGSALGVSVTKEVYVIPNGGSFEV
eukprot:SAG11_NODE_18867_length_479_cov_1.489474_1_plen_54_part_10